MAGSVTTASTLAFMKEQLAENTECHTGVTWEESMNTIGRNQIAIFSPQKSWGKSILYKKRRRVHRKFAGAFVDLINRNSIKATRQEDAKKLSTLSSKLIAFTEENKTSTDFLQSLDTFPFIYRGGIP